MYKNTNLTAKIPVKSFSFLKPVCDADLFGYLDYLESNC